MTEPLELHSTLRLSQAVISGAARHASAIYCMDDLTHYVRRQDHDASLNSTWIGLDWAVFNVPANTV